MKERYIKKGFTLAELLVVIAIIAVLVAVSIPVFGAQIEKARTAVCMANKRGLKAVLSVQYMSGELSDADITKEKISLNSANDYTYDKQTFICPKGGTIYAQMTNLAIEVRCTYHDDEQHSTETKYEPWTAGTAEKIWDILRNPQKGFNGTADSFGEGKAGNTIKLNAALSAAGITLKDLGAASWHFENAKCFIWTSADISKMVPGQKVTVIKYNFTDGSYTVGEAAIASNTSDTNKTYNIIKDITAGTEKTNSLTSAEKKDIGKIIDVYNQYSDTKLEK